MKKKPQALEAIESLSRYVHAERGRLAKVMAMFHERTGVEVHHPTMIRWLHPDPAKRTEPLLESGLVLIEIAADLCGKKRRANSV